MFRQHVHFGVQLYSLQDVLIERVCTLILIFFLGKTMDSLPKFSDNLSSTASTQVIDYKDKTSHSTVIQNKLSFTTGTVKVEIESKTVVPQEGDVLRSITGTNAWLDLFEKLAVKG